MENYCWNDDLINISRLLFSLITLLTFPLECMVTKVVVDQTLRGGTDITSVPMSKKRHGIITISILIATYLVSISTKCLGIALELNVSISKFLNYPYMIFECILLYIFKVFFIIKQNKVYIIIKFYIILGSYGCYSIGIRFTSCYLY